MPKNLKDKRIQIQQLDEVTERYQVVATVWAHFRSMSVREQYECGADFAWSNVYFTIFRSPDFELSTYDRIIYDGRTYEIEAIDLFEDVTGKNVRIQARCRYY